MKIIKQGKKPDPKVVRFECDECGSVFEEEPRKCVFLYRKVLDESPVFSVECPVCCKTVISDKILASLDEKEQKEKALTDWQRADLLNDIADLHGKVPEKAEQILRDAVDAAWVGDIAKAHELTSKAVALSFLG